MMGIFLSCYNEGDREFVMEYLALLEVPSTKSAVLLDELVKILKEREIDPQKTRFCCLDGTNSMSGEISGLQRRIRHISPHSMYVNCRCHRLALCFKHLIDQFSWLAKLDKLLLGLWKSFHYIALNRSILTEIQKGYGMKALHLVKAVVTRWLSHGATCKRCLERYEEILEALDQVLVAKPNPEISGYWSDLLEPSTVLELSLLDDILTIISKLCLLLQSDRKDFRAIYDIVVQSLITLKSPALIEEFCNFNAESIASKQLQVDSIVTVEHFYSSTTIPFIKALIVETKGTFPLGNLPVLRAITCLNPNKIPKENGKNDISTLYDFYDKQRDDVFDGRRVTSLPILACKVDSLPAEYNGYKAYAARQRIKQYKVFKNVERNLKARLLQASANRYKKKRDMKVIKAELSEIKKKMCSPMAVENLLDDTVLSTAFPTIRRLLRVYVIIPFSEAVVERGFSK